MLEPKIILQWPARFFSIWTLFILVVSFGVNGSLVASTSVYPENEPPRWAIIFYQIVVGKKEANIEFSGLKRVTKIPHEGGEIVVSKFYHRDQKSCEFTLMSYSGENKIKKVPSFDSKYTYILTSDHLLSDDNRIIINAFQCMKIF